MHSAAAVAERTTTVWKPMASAPKNGLILLKCPIEGHAWPMIGRWRAVHGGFCTVAVFGQNEQVLLGASAWAEIPAYDDGASV